MYPLTTRLSASGGTRTMGTACPSRKASHRTPGTPRLGRTTTAEADSGTALYGFTRSSGEIQRLPLASSGRSLCLVSNAAFGTGRCRQTSGLYRHQTHLASPLASHLGDGTTQLRNWSTSPDETDGAQKSPDDRECLPRQGTLRRRRGNPAGLVLEGADGCGGRTGRESNRWQVRSR